MLCCATATQMRLEGGRAGTTLALPQQPTKGTDRIALRAMARSARRCWYPPRSVIITQGDTAHSAFFIRRGLVKLIATRPEGRERIVRLLGRGGWIGLGGLLNPMTEHAAIAVGPVEAYRLSLTRLRRLKQTHPDLYCRLTETWYECLQDADLWLTQFCCGPVRARVARLVNFLACMHGSERSSEVELLTCDEMAGILAVTPESVSRTLAQFKRSGILSAERSRSHVVRYRRDALALQALAND